MNVMIIWAKIRLFTSRTLPDTPVGKAMILWSGQNQDSGRTISGSLCNDQINVTMVTTCRQQTGDQEILVSFTEELCHYHYFLVSEILLVYL